MDREHYLRALGMTGFAEDPAAHQKMLERLKTSEVTPGDVASAVSTGTKLLQNIQYWWDGIGNVAT